MHHPLGFVEQAFGFAYDAPNEILSASEVVVGPFGRVSSAGRFDPYSGESIASDYGYDGYDDGTERRTSYTSNGRVAYTSVRSHVASSPCSGAPGEARMTARAWWSASDSRAIFVDEHGDAASSPRLVADAALDWAGRPVQARTKKDLEWASMVMQYDGLGRLIHYEDPWSTATDRFYDSLGQLVLSTQNEAKGASGAGGLETSYAYDRDGYLTHLTDPAGAVTSYVYDGLGRTIRSIVPNADGSGTLLADIDRGRCYDPLGRLRQVTQGPCFSGQTPTQADLVADYDYQLGTHLLTDVATETSASHFAYGPRARLVQASRTERGRTVSSSRSYDGRGALVSETTALPNATYDVSLGYGPYGRLTSLASTSPDVALQDLTVDFDYSGSLLAGIRGHRSGQPVDTLGMAFEYVGSIPVQRELIAPSVGGAADKWLTTDTELDAVGRPTRRAFSRGGSLLVSDEVTYAKDDRRIASLKTWGQAGTVQAGQLTVAARYDGMHRLDGLREARATGSQDVRAWQSWLDDGTHIRSLRSATVDGKQLTATLGGAWHALERTPLGTLVGDDRDDAGGDWQATTFLRGPGLTSVTLGPEQVSLSWDDRGRLISAGSLDITWTGDNLPAELRTGATTGARGQHAVRPTEERVYDAFGRVVQIVRDGEELDLVYAGAEVLREVSMCGERVWWPSGGLDQPAAYTLSWDSACDNGGIPSKQRVKQLQLLDLSPDTAAAYASALTSAEGASFALLQDLHNDVIGVVDAEGILVEGYQYDAYGARSVLDPTGAVVCTSGLGEPCASEFGNTRGYTGRPLSSLTGLYDLRARQYDPHLRIFISPDPLGYVDSFDLWQYVGGDPLNRWDPFGLENFDFAQFMDDAATQALADDGGPSVWDAMDAGLAGGGGFAVGAGQAVVGTAQGAASLAGGAYGLVFGDVTVEDVGEAAAESWDNVKALPGAVADSFNNAHADPSGWGGLMGNLFGGVEIGIAGGWAWSKWAPGALKTNAAVMDAAVAADAAVPIEVLPGVGTIARKGKAVPEAAVPDATPSPTRAGSDNAPRSSLPRDEAGNYLPDPAAEGPHTALGTRRGRRKWYTQGTTFDENGVFQGLTDVTDHGRSHPNPHYHPAKGPNSIEHGAHPLPDNTPAGTRGPKCP